MSTIVIKTIRGRRYAYQHRTWREGKRVRCETTYLGPVDGPQRIPKKTGPTRRSRRQIGPNSRRDDERIGRALERYAERIDAMQRERFGETATERQERERQVFLDDLHGRFGLRVEAAPPPAPAPTPTTAPPATEAEESPSAATEGQGVADAATATGQNS